MKCYSAGQENYADGSPKKWWSKLAVVQDGKEVESKEIVVNDPLVYHGLRFYQASYWIDRQKVDGLQGARHSDSGLDREVTLPMNEPVNLDANTTVTLVEFIPDAFVRDGQVFKKSDNLENLAFRLEVVNTHRQLKRKAWLFPA